MSNVRTGTVRGYKFEKRYLFVIKPQDPMIPIYRKIVPEFGLDIVKNMLDKNGDRYFYNELEI